MRSNKAFVVYQQREEALKNNVESLITVFLPDIDSYDRTTFWLNNLQKQLCCKHLRFTI